nr:translation initiation factor IF-3, mitochondrial isoform X2 [Dasypus novemcinctus]
MHRADVIKLLDQRDLRLVRRNSSADPPEYQLLTGLQIHEERLRLREREKATPKAGPTQVKELTFSSNIGPHDLDTKSKQIQQWIEKKYQVQITIKKGKNVQEPENKMEELFNQILQTMPGMATFLARPHTIKGGRAAVCVLRCLSKKEENEYRRTQETQKGDVLSKESGPHGKSEVLQP